VRPPHAVTVIIPVYRGIDDVARCLESVFRHARGTMIPFELVVIDDASPEDDVREYVSGLTSESTPVAVDVLRNTENLGFVKTVNRGLRQAGGDVVILNADTAVTAGWLDRLAAVAAHDDVATVSPLTNDGSICTLPRSIINAFALDGPEPRVDECASFVAGHSLRLFPEVISGVGFCMYTTRQALDLCGHLDEGAFGLGYGEEVDFCLRATRLGLRHLVDDSTFVYHRGSGSFGERQREMSARAQTILDERYPFFRPTNTKERSHDPLRVPFAALELGLHERDSARPHVLQVMHSPPGATGGTEKFVQSLMEALHDEWDFSTLYPTASGFGLRTFWNVGSGDPVQEEFLLPGAPVQVTQVHDEVAGMAVTTALDMFDFDAVHIHNLVGHSLSPLAALTEFRGPVLSSVHDLFLACPNFSLLYRKEEPCGVPEDLSYCQRCLEVIAVSPMPGSPMIGNLSVEYLGEFRASVGEHLDVVDHWVFASQSAADYLLRVYEPEEARIEIIEHGSPIHLTRRRREPDEELILDEPLRLAFVGLGWSKKGLAIVNELADRFRDSSVEIHHFGDLKEPGSTNIVTHGPYDNECLPELLHRAGIQIVLLPGPYAETFGIVMTEALVAGIPVIGARYGALGERIRASGAGWTIDPMDSEGVRELIVRLDLARDEILRATREVLAIPLETVADTAHRYADLYRNPPHVRVTVADRVAKAV